MYHPTTRLLTVLELLQTHGQMSSTELAARLEVDARTVRRYIRMLQDLGIPIETEMGRYGGYALRPGFKLPPMMFTNDEALTLILGLVAARQTGLAAEALSVEGALAKLQRVLPQALREQTQAMQHTLAFDLPATEPRVRSALLAVLGRAAYESHQVTISYHKGDERTARRVDPYGLVCHDRVWYLIGYCHLREGIRIFRLDRIGDLRVEAEEFAAPDDFDSLTYLLNSFAVIPDQWDVEVILKTTLENAVQAIPGGLGVIQEHPDGVFLRTSVKDLDWMARYLVGLGFRVRVCQPPELRGAFERLASEVAQYAQVSG